MPSVLQEMMHLVEIIPVEADGQAQDLLQQQDLWLEPQSMLSEETMMIVSNILVIKRNGPKKLTSPIVLLLPESLQVHSQMPEIHPVL